MKTITDPGPHVCTRDMSIRKILGRIDASPYLFQVVLDETGRLEGTITDGDIRRAMLKGAGLDDAASVCMQSRPTTGRLGDATGNRAMLSHVGSSRMFLPILDEDGILAEILVAGGEGAISSALVMAGGPGTRLGEHTRTTPKPLLVVGGRPILDHVLCALEAAEVQRVFVSVHYLAEQIEAFVAARDNRLEIEFLHEDERLGTAGALGLLGPSAPREPLLVVNGDLITNVDLKALYDFHHRHDFDGTVAVARYDVDIPFGVIRYGEDGLFESIDEKPRISSFVAAGVYCLSPEYLALVPDRRAMDMPELLNIGKEIGLSMGLFPIHEFWSDVGRPEDLQAVNDRIGQSHQ